MSRKIKISENLLEFTDENIEKLAF